jgi:hypothetical protein
LEGQEDMKLSEFKIGMEFEMSGQRWRCTDIGTRTVAAICLDDIPQNDPSWLNGPPYAVVEDVIDEYDFPVCFAKEVKIVETAGK